MRENTLHLNVKDPEGVERKILLGQSLHNWRHSLWTYNLAEHRFEMCMIYATATRELGPVDSDGMDRLVLKIAQNHCDTQTIETFWSDKITPLLEPTSPFRLAHAHISSMWCVPFWLVKDEIKLTRLSGVVDSNIQRYDGLRNVSLGTWAVEGAYPAVTVKEFIPEWRSALDQGSVKALALLKHWPVNGPDWASAYGALFKRVAELGLMDTFVDALSASGLKNDSSNDWQNLRHDGSLIDEITTDSGWRASAPGELPLSYPVIQRMGELLPWETYGRPHNSGDRTFQLHSRAVVPEHQRIR